MITLYGFPASNYYGLIKHVLMLKEIAFIEQRNYAADAEYLLKSPMGKVPCIATPEGFLSESIAIIEYLEGAYQDKPIASSDPYQRAKAIEIMRIAELYIELSARHFLPAILMGTEPSKEAKGKMLPVLKKAFASLESMPTFSPYLMGDSCSIADLCARYALKTGLMVGDKIFDLNFFGETPKLAQWWKLMNDDPISQQVDSQAEASFPEFMNYLQQAFANKNNP